MNKGILVSLGVLGVGATAWYLNNQYLLAKKMCFKAIGFTVDNLSSQGSVINVKMQVKNFGSFGIIIKNYNFDVMADGVYLATVFSQTDSIIPANGVSEFILNIAINPTVLIQNIGSILSSSDFTNMKISINGKVKVEKFGLPFTIPVTYRFDLKEITSGNNTQSSC